jgi:hypothetical protein
VIDYGFYGQLATITIACLWIAVTIVRRSREAYRPLTVDAEDQKCRGVVKALAQHYPPLTFHDDEATDDAVFALVRQMDDDRRVGRI